MLENYCRPLYQKILVDPLALHLKNKISPTQITLLAAVIGVIIAPLLYFHQNLLALLALACSGYLDTLDGTVARLSAKSSDNGAMVDIIADRIVECAIIFGLYFIAPTQRATACLAILASILICVTSFLVVGIFNQNQSAKSFHYSPGLIERAEAFIFFSAMLLFPAWFNWLASIFISLVLLTAVLRTKEFIQKHR